MNVDHLEEFRPELAEFKMSKEQEDELLLTLWQIMNAFVDFGWGVDSVQMVFPELKEIFSETASDELRSPHSKTLEHEKGAAHASPLELGDS
jgi:hypothetical protein